MPGISFEEATGSEPSKPSKGISFEEAVGSKDETKAAFGKYPRPGMEPGKDTPTVSSLGAFASSAAEGIAATPGVMAGARVGAAMMPPVAPVLGPLSKPAGALLGGIGGGILAGSTIKAAESFADKIFGTNISSTREQQQKQYPYASLAGQVAGGAFNPLMRPGLPSSISQGTTGAGIMTVVGATQRAIQGGDPFDPVAMTVDATTGAFTKPTKLGERVLGHTAVAEPKKATSNIPDPPPPDATPEQKAEFLKKVQEVKAKAPLVEAAIKNKETGEIERMGPKHDQARKDATKDTHEEGFVDEFGVFHERTAAVDQAKRAGQIPEDHVLDNPPGETPGLHSGDLRKAGVKQFEEKNTTDVITDTLKDASEPVKDAAEKVDVKSIPNEEEFYKHAAEIHSKYGDEEAIKFFEDYNKNLQEQSIPVPNSYEELDDALHKVNTFQTRDRSENVSWYKENTDNGVTAEDRAKWFDMRERGEELPPEAKAVLDVIDQENLALVRKIKAMGGDVGEEFTKGQSRIRIFGDVESNWLNTIKEFFSNGGTFGDKVADKANAAIERKVYQLDDGRVVEIHRQNEDVSTPSREIAKGTEIWEWKNGKKSLIGHTDNLDFKRGDKIILNNGKEVTMVDGSVEAIEKESPYKYLHDAEASARLANIGLRKMARELELVNNLKKSELFKQVGFNPEQPVKDLPKGWRVPNNIDRIPELRGWHFDPKTAAIIEDFAKVWDKSMWMNLTNALVKNMMLNPVPHMFNEVMHLWNARGFTGWVDPRRMAMFADTARQAWNDVGNQSKFYRDIMREGGSILGADPRNKEFFEPIFENAKKDIFGDKDSQRSISQLAKRLGTSVGDLYNGISKASNKAMWFTRDVMYVQYVREIMAEAKKRNIPMDLKGAIKEAEKHMPNYRLPSEVAGSRGLSQVLRNPNISMFSRYHYGMVKSLVNTIKDVDPRNLSSPEGRKHFREGVDSMLAIGVAMGALYPLMDYIAESIFGEGAQQRRAGPYHLIQAGVDVAEGKKDASALIWPVFTFNPVLLSLGQLGFNKNIFTGKGIYHPDDPLGDILGDVGEYAAKQVPQVSTAMSATKDESGETQLLAKQLDIKVKTKSQKEREKKAIEREKRAAKGRLTKREKGTYTP